MAALALTVLLAILWIALVGAGYWHGGWRQIVLLAAMLLSSAVLSEWAAPNGRDLSARFNWSAARATTGVALLYLLGGTLVLGVLGSFALYRPRPLGPVERRFGAAMGVLDGGLLLALVLRTLRSYAFAAGRGQALRDSPLARFLIEDVGYLLLVALVLGAAAAVVGAMVARRDAVREMTLLDAVATPAAERHGERPAVSPPPMQPPPVPVYATAPLIDWPTGPPPGVRSAPPPAASLPAPEAPKAAPQPDAARPPVSLPARPELPPRVPPPMIYPVADLIAVQAKPATRVASGPPGASPPPVSPQPGPASLAAAPKETRPVGPPPGATPPAFGPPTAQRESIRAEVAQESPPPSSPPKEESPSAVPEPDPPTDEATPPVVRTLDVATQDVPVVGGATTPQPEKEKEQETMQAETQKPPPVPPSPGATLATTAMPTVVPPRPPPMPANRPASGQPPRPSSGSADEAKARAGFARVAVARQGGGRHDEAVPPQPHPQPAAPPEPLQPPLPTGPRVHQCPTCGYPVRDHARYCPNCGSRQGR